MKKKIYCMAVHAMMLFICIVFSSSSSVLAQEITVYQYRHVDPAKMDEFIKRETTYWSKVAQKAVDGGKMSFWALFEKVGGVDMATSSNVLFINTFPDLDIDMGSVFNPAKLFPGVPMAKMETNSLSTTTGQYFVQGQGWQELTGVNPEKDFQYVKMNYHNSTDPQAFNAIEMNNWAPFIKTAMDKKQTQQKAWGNAIVLSPSGGPMKFNCLSYDLYSSLNAALLEKWSPEVVFPMAGLDSLRKIAIEPPASFLYRIVKVVSKN